MHYGLSPSGLGLFAFAKLSRISLSVILASAMIFAPVLIWADAPPDAAADVSAEAREPTSSESTTSTASEESIAAPTAAARISELRDTIEEAQARLKKLEAELKDPESEYHQAEAAFRELTAEVEATTTRLNAAIEADDTEQIQRLEREMNSLVRLRKLAEDRFDVAIESRKTLRDEIQTLKGKLEKDQVALDELTGERTEPEADSKPDGAKPESPSAKPDEKEPASSEQPAEPATEESGEQSSKSDAEKTSADKKDDDAEQDEELMKAEEEVRQKEQEAKEAEADSRSLESRIQDLKTLVAHEQKELGLARRKADLAVAEQASLTAEITTRQLEGASDTEILALRKALASANHRLFKARAEVSEISERLSDHREELASLQSEHILALHEAKQKQQAADEAESRRDALRNPFALRNIAQWLLDHGIRLLLIVAGMFLLNRLASFFAHRSVRFVSSHANRGNKIERENRARTLVGVFQNAATVAIFVTGSLMILEEVGANITVLMGGVAVVGLAVAFGAQNLIKDYFYGFVMLLENQYILNDSIRINSVSGQVERITLRMTVLRDSNGVVHFIPNGTINSVSNETHGWSRAVCELAVGYQERLDVVLATLREIASELKQDPVYGPLMMEKPKDPAIDSLGEFAIHIKTAVKTLPNQHGFVKQEWLRRIHLQFQQLGIAPAYPRRMLSFASDAVLPEHAGVPEHVGVPEHAGVPEQAVTHSDNVQRPRAA